MTARIVPYQHMPEPPSEFTAGGVMKRMTDAIAFRFRWATEGLADGDLNFKPCEGSMTMRELFEHMLLLIQMVHGALDPERTGLKEKLDDMESYRIAVLRRLERLGDRIEDLSDAELGGCEVKLPSGKAFPVWNLIHGPLADMLTHVGQINSWRRIAGKPAPKANLFLGLAPR